MPPSPSASLHPLPPPDGPHTTEIIVLLQNLRKNTPLGPILRCLSACGIRQLWTVGYAQCTNVQGAHGADKHIQITGFPTADQAVAAAFTGDTAVSSSSLTATTRSVTILGLLGALPNGYNEKEGYPVVVNDAAADDTQNLVLPVVTQHANHHHQQQHTTHLLGRSYPVYALPLSVSALRREQRESQPPQQQASPCKSNTPHRATNNILCLVISSDRKLGLPLTLARHCHVFCHVPCIPLNLLGVTDHETEGATALPLSSPQLLDGPTTITITLQHLITRLGDAYVNHQETKVEGHKFIVADPPLVVARRPPNNKEQNDDDEANYQEDDNDEDHQGDANAQRFFWNNNNTDGDY